MSTNAAHLAEKVLQRRTDLDLSQIDVWRTGGPSNTTLTTIENGLLTNLTASTARKLDAGLLWEKGSARRVWEGGEPTPLGGGRRDEGWLRERIDEAEISAATRARLLAALDGHQGVRGA
jgi:hypothetical protein